MIRQVSLTLSLWFTLQTTQQYDTSMQQLEPTLTTRAVVTTSGPSCKASRESLDSLLSFSIHYVLIQIIFFDFILLKSSIVFD